MSFCEQCGSVLKPDSKFCAQCGARLQGPPSPVPPPLITNVLSVNDMIKNLAVSSGATLEEKRGVLTMRKVVAERKAFLNTKKLEYIAKIRIVDSGKEVRFTEMLKESGWGLGGLDAGGGFKVESYKTGFDGQRDGGIKEQSKLFGKKYDYSFNWGDVRVQIEKYTANAGYSFVYKITPSGL